MLAVRGTWARLRGDGPGMGALGALAMLPFVAIAVVAGIGAASTVGRPFPGFFTDPYGDFSNVSLPAWRLEETGLRYPDRLVEIDGQPLSTGFLYPARAAADEYRRLGQAERATVELAFETPGGKRTIRR